MHSGCFAASPKAAAEVLSAWLDGELLLASTEVLDLDEEVYRQGRWVVRLYAEAMTPASPRWMQGAKQRIEASGEEEVLEGLADHIQEMLHMISSLIERGKAYESEGDVFYSVKSLNKPGTFLLPMLHWLL